MEINSGEGDQASPKVETELKIQNFLLSTYMDDSFPDVKMWLNLSIEVITKALHTNKIVIHHQQKIKTALK